MDISLTNLPPSRLCRDGGRSSSNLAPLNEKEFCRLAELVFNTVEVAYWVFFTKKKDTNGDLLVNFLGIYNKEGE